MISISLCMIVKNEENCLANCLNSVKNLVDEIIIVDTGSTDNTRSIIQEYTDHIYSFEWVNDFSAARNYAFSKATKDYILWLDADDIFLPKDQVLLQSLKETLSQDIDIITMIYDITFNEKGECTLSIPRDKLIKNGKGFYWKYFVHEELVVWGNYYHSSIHVTHTSDHGHYSRYLPNYNQRIADGYPLLPHEKYFYGGELYMAQKYEKCILVLEDFLKNPSNNPIEIKRANEFLINCYTKTNQIDKALAYYFQQFIDSTPDATTCYQIGLLFQKSNRTTEAIFWYELVVNPSINWGTSTLINSLLIPTYLQLCVCSYANHELQKACEYNDKVLLLEPDNPSGIYNKNFFESLKSTDI